MPEVKKVVKTEDEILFEKPDHYDPLDAVKRKKKSPNKGCEVIIKFVGQDK